MEWKFLAVGRLKLLQPFDGGSVICQLRFSGLFTELQAIFKKGSVDIQLSLLIY